VETQIFSGINLETARLRIRALTQDDAPPLHAVVSQPEVMAFLPEDVMSEEETRQVLSWSIDCYRKNTPAKIFKFTVAIVLKHTNELIGWCGLGPLDFDESEIEVYFGLSHDRWGHGYATEAARTLLGYGFDTIGLRRIVAVVDPRNAASVRVIEKSGMVLERPVAGLPAKHAHYEGYRLYALERQGPNG
jgi:ribosomal-protein-alanine N-acetyltransferase